MINGMKRNVLIPVLYGMLSMLLVSCSKNEPRELLKVTNYQFTFNDYSTLPGSSFAYANQYFTPQHPAKEYIADWLFGRYYTVAEGSTALVSYRYRDYDHPESLNKLSQTVKVFAPNDYKVVWGEVYADFFTPSMTPEQEIPKILAAQGQAEEGDFKVVQYQYSAVEATIVPNKEVVYLSEDFNTVGGNDWAQLSYTGWYNQDVSGIGIRWRIRVAGANRIPTGYSRDRRGADSWLINANSVDLGAARNPNLSFTYGIGYFVQNQPSESFDCLTVNLTSSFNGTNPALSTWKDVSEVSGIRNVTPASGYPGTSTYTVNLAEFVGGNVHVGFRYYLPTRSANYAMAPLYYVDNIKISEKLDVAEVPATEKKYGLFVYKDYQWEAVDDSFYILQDVDYLSINMPTLNAVQAAQHLPLFLDSKFSSANVGDMITVVYKRNENDTAASQFEYTESGWKSAGRDIETKVDRYIFTDATKWAYDSTN